MARVVDDIDRVRVHGRIIIQQVIHALVSEREGKDGPARKGGFLPVGDGARINQVHHARGEQFCMNAELMALGEVAADFVRKRANAHLEAGTILHIWRDHFGNGEFFLLRWAFRHFEERLVILDEGIDL